MAWIELHQAVWTHRKTFELAARLDLDETYAAAHVVRLWTWALDNAPDGDLSSLSARAIAYGSGWRGEAEAFVEALIGSGWLDPDQRIHDWDEYAGRLIERRRQDADRKRISRGRQQDVPATSGVPDPTGPNSTGPDRLTPSGLAAHALAREADAVANGATAPPKPKADTPARVPTSGKTSAPEALAPSEVDYTVGEQNGLDRPQVEAAAAAMLDFWRAKGEPRADWHATLRTWLRNAPKFDRPRAPPPLNGSDPPPDQPPPKKRLPVTMLETT